VDAEMQQQAADGKKENGEDLQPDFFLEHIQFLSCGVVGSDNGNTAVFYERVYLCQGRWGTRVTGMRNEIKNALDRTRTCGPLIKSDLLANFTSPCACASYRSIWRSHR
jgi:hypothetical protein